VSDVLEDLSSSALVNAIEENSIEGIKAFFSGFQVDFFEQVVRLRIRVSNQDGMACFHYLHKSRLVRSESQVYQNSTLEYISLQRP